MNNIVQRIENLNQSVENIDFTLQELKKYPKDIELLSVNATIQAVHAKDAGRGFSIVAKEMESLSNKMKKQLDMLSLEISFYMQQMKGIREVQKETIEKKDSM